MKLKEKKRTRLSEDARKKQIMDAAIKVFVSKGFHEATTDDIMNEAQIGKGTIYQHFKNKKELFIAVVDRGLDELQDVILAEVEKTDDPLKKIENAIRTYLTFFERRSDLIGILIHEQSTFQERIAKRYFEHYYGNVDRIKQTFKTGIAQGLMKKMDIDGAISVLTSLLNGQLYMWQIEGRKYRLSDRASVLLKIFFTGIIKDQKRKREYE